MDAKPPDPEPAPRPLAANCQRIHQVARELFARFGLDDWAFGFNRRKSHLGVCFYERKLIQLSLYFVVLNDDEAIRDTLLHEIAHALVGPGHGHGPVWKRKCREVGARPERLCHQAAMPAGRWQARCGGCAKVHTRHRRPKRLTGWYCRQCGPEKGSLHWRRAL